MSVMSGCWHDDEFTQHTRAAMPRLGGLDAVGLTQPPLSSPPSSAVCVHGLHALHHGHVAQAHLSLLEHSCYKGCGMWGGGDSRSGSADEPTVAGDTAQSVNDY
jgi:hypothetical protein